MKKHIIYLIILFANCFCLSAQTPDTSVNHPLTREEYLKKSKSQKTGAFILLGIGAVSFAVAAPGNVDFGILGVVVVLGGTSALTSIPLFIASGKNKRKAMLLPSSQKTSFSLPLNSTKFIHGITLNIPL